LGCTDRAQLGRMQVVNRAELKFVHIDRKGQLIGHYQHPYCPTRSLCGRPIEGNDWTFKYAELGYNKIHCRKCLDVVYRGKVKVSYDRSNT
jgi:hypothetical protein